MLMPPDQIEYYNQGLLQQLQRLVTTIRGYQAMKAAKGAELPNQATRLWEMNQRYILVKGTNDPATLALHSACQKAYEGVHVDVLTLVEEVFEIAIQLADFEQVCYEVKEEKKLSRLPDCLKKLFAFLEETVRTLQTQAKYTELCMRQLQPHLGMGESVLEDFKSGFHLSEYDEANITFGLAKIDRLLKNPMNSLQETLDDP